VKSGYTSYSGVKINDKTGFYSVHIWLLPFMEAGNVFDLINFDVAQIKIMRESTNPNYRAYATAQGLFLCPSDGNQGQIVSENNYRSNFGGSTPGAGGNGSTTLGLGRQWLKAGNGAFSIGKKGFKTGHFTDGLSTTAFFSERVKGSAGGDDGPVSMGDMHRLTGITDTVSVDNLLLRCQNQTPEPGPYIFKAMGRWLAGSIWSNGWPFAGYDSSQYNHVAPPNSPAMDCGASYISDTHNEHAIVAARSDHPGMVVVAFGDGHTQLFSDDVNIRVWRAMGSRNGEEIETSE
jgi:hypothetical protein